MITSTLPQKASKKRLDPHPKGVREGRNYDPTTTLYLNQATHE